MADETTMEATERDQRAAISRLRVGIAGATGYAGQELVRLLARHPTARLTMATGSQATSTPRRLPSLKRIWDGDVLPLDVPALVAAADTIFLALPEAASADLAPQLLAAGARVVDLSGAFRLREQETRSKWYPATGAMPDGVAYGLTEFELSAIKTPTSSSTRSRESPAPARPRPIARTSARTTAVWLPTGHSDIATRPRWSRRSDSG
jgi:Semialdehyde dehydrogenase, NAD binding domain